MFLLKLKKDFLDFISFIKKPNDLQLKITTKEKFSLFLSLLIIDVIYNLLVAIPIILLVNAITPIKNRNFDNLQNMTLLFTFMGFVVIMPIVEELLFRYCLRYNILFSKLIKREKWDRIFPFLVYTLSSIFGFIHLRNYDNDSWIFYALAPLIILSQLTGGLFLSYIRIRLNIFYSILFHSIWNALFSIVLPSLFLVSGTYTNKGKNYDIKIQEQLFYKKSKPTTLKLNEKGEKIYTLDAQQYQLQQLSDTIYGKGKYITDEDILININLKSETGVSKEEFRKILQENYTIEKPKK